jgi:hypothetical protein
MFSILFCHWYLKIYLELAPVQIQHQSGDIAISRIPWSDLLTIFCYARFSRDNILCLQKVTGSTLAGTGT